MRALTNIAIEEIVNMIKDRILAIAPETEAIYLFGSYAYGTPREDSDLDICVIVPDDTADLLGLRGKIRSGLYRKVSMPLDLIIKKSKDFKKRKAGVTLDRDIAENGVLIYG